MISENTRFSWAAQLRQRVRSGERKAPLAREFGISRETLYQYLRTED